MGSSPLTELELIQRLMRRDRQRKLIALVLVSGLTGAAIYAQAVWVLAVLATALAGGSAWWKRSDSRNHPDEHRTRGR